MEYSIKKYIKKECSDKYNLNDIDTIAQNISIDSDGKYTKQSALKIICKYAKIEDGKIIFNPEERDMNKTYDDLKSIISDISNISDMSDNKTDKIDKTDKIEAKPKPIKKSGFGSFTNVTITEDHDLDIEINEIKDDKPKKSGFGVFKPAPKDIDEVKDNKPNKPKKGGFGFFKPIPKEIDEDTIPTNSSEDNYHYPIENKFTGFTRSDPKYGPYGTDSIHDEQNDDVIGSIEKKRLKQYNVLNSKYYPPQRSAEWFAMRNEMITASDGGTVVGLNPYEDPYDFIFKKVYGKPFETSIDCYHGKKYEGIATMIYEYRMNVIVKEFGLCRHNLYSFLGASPDGIVAPHKLDGNHATKYVGRMLEIKCPMRRKILMTPDAIEVYGPHGEPIIDKKKDVKKGICPAYYWVQVQLQLQCCELDECDFWQCEIVEYMDAGDFRDDCDHLYPWLSQTTQHEKGALIQIMPIDKLINDDDVDGNVGIDSYNKKIWNFAEFIYPPRIEMTPFEIDQWVLETVQNLGTTHPGKVFEQVLYWKVVTTRSNTIKKDDKWFNDNLDTFSKAWDYVEYFRNNEEKASLLKRYVKSLKRKYNDTIMKIIDTLYNEPDPKNTKDVLKYNKFIDGLEDEITKRGIQFAIVDDHDENLKYVLETLNMNLPENDTDKKKFKEFVKGLKKKVDKYLIEDK